jgi:hypothetical protein
VKKTNPHDSNNQNAITFEGGHTNDGSGSISEGASELTKSFEIYHKMISGAWKQPKMPLPWEQIIGPKNILPTQWYIQ